MQAHVVKDELRRLDMDGLRAAVGDGHVGAQLPSCVVQRDLHGDAVGREWFDKDPVAHKVVAALRALLPAGHAVLNARRLHAGRPPRCGDLFDVDRRDEPHFAVGCLDLDRIAFVVVEHGDFFAAFKRCDYL